MAIEHGYKIEKECTVPLMKEPSGSGRGGLKVAVIGGGPAGLACAAGLAKKGHAVTIFEAEEFLGGILRYGIPTFRLERKIVEDTIDKILKLGIEVKTQVKLEKDYTIQSLKEEGYDAIFLGIGANIATYMGIEGENLYGVFGGNELLKTNKHPDYTSKRVAVIGGGNTAMDIARTAKRMGAKESIVIYRRDESHMPAEKKEIKDAKDDEIQFMFKTNIIKIMKGNKTNLQIECIKTELAKAEEGKRKVPVDVKR